MASWFLTAPPKRIVLAFRNLIDEFRSFGVAYQSSYDSAIAWEMAKLVKLQESDGLELTDRIRPAIEDAAKCYHSVRWREIFWSAARRRFRVLAVICAGVVLCLKVLSGVIPKLSLIDQKTYDNGLVTIAVLVLLIVGGLCYRQLSSRNKTSTLLIAGVAAGIAVNTFRTWSPYVHSNWDAVVSRLSPLRPRYRTQLASMPIAHELQCVLWYIMILCIGLSLFRLIFLCGRAVTSRKEFGYGQPAEECAEVIIAILNLSYSITEILEPAPTGSGDIRNHPEPDKITAPWLNGQRQYLDGLFNGLVCSIRGSWRRAMRDSYGPAGKLIADEAPRIELFIRHQQAKNALQGNLLQLRDAMTSILVHAADGNWHLIGAEEEYANKAIVQRRARVIRRAIIIGLSIAAAIVLAHFMRNYPALAITCGLFAFAEVLRLFDPDGPTLLDVAGRVANTLKRGG